MMKDGIIFLSSGFMTLIWRYAWANYLTIAAFHRPFPLLESIITLGMGSFLVFITLDRGWRVIWVLCIQVMGFALVLSRMIYVFHEYSFPFLNPQWLVEFAGNRRDLLEWLTLFFIALWTLIFWAGGWLLARRPGTYTNTCARFDIGLAFLLALFLIKYVIWFRGGIETPDPLSGAMLFPFFLFSMLAIALARNGSAAQREYLPGYRGMGVILGFTVVVLLFGTGLISLFLPYLTLAARAGYDAIRIAAEPLTPVLVAIVRFIFHPRRMHMEPQSSLTAGDSSDTGPPMDTGWWAGPLGEIARYLVLGLAGLVILMLVLVLLWLLLRLLLSGLNRLFSRTSYTRRNKWDPFAILAALLGRVFHFYSWIDGLMSRNRKGAIQLYASLLGWGSRSGMPRSSIETPLEYGARLKNRFPALEREVGSIIDLFNQEFYGGTVADVRWLALGNAAWRRMRSPVHWVNRAKVWFLSA